MVLANVRHACTHVAVLTHVQHILDHTRESRMFGELQRSPIEYMYRYAQTAIAILLPVAKR